MANGNGGLGFEWDEAKRRENLRKHGIDFIDAPELFGGPMLEIVDDREEYGEERWIGVGLLRGRVIVVAYAYRGEELVRVISLRKALSHERAQFEAEFQDRLGESRLPD